MNTVSIISGHTDPFYYHFLFEGQIKVESYSGSEVSLRRKMKLLRVDSILDLCWQFKKIDEQIIDHRKNVHVHSEHRKRLQDYVEWGHENRDSLTGSVIQNAEIVATKYLKPILDLIQDEQPLKKQLVSIVACIIETGRGDKIDEQ